MGKKVLITASSFSHICSFHLPYLEKFKSLGWEVHVACGGDCRSIPFADKCFSVPFEKNLSSLANFKASLFLRHLIRESGYDLVIMHTSLASFFTRLAEKGLPHRPKTVHVMHGYLFGPSAGKKKSAMLVAAEYLVSHETDLILTMNHWDQTWTKKHFPGVRQMMIPGMGVTDRCLQHDTPVFLKGVEDFVLVYAAEFSARKNQSFLIRSLPLLPANVKLILPGEGDRLASCRQLASDLALQERVIFPGHIQKIGSALYSADVAVSSSHSEGLPFNLLEAMMWGLPIVASDVKGNNDLVKHGVNGLLFEDNDRDSFIREVEMLMESSERRAEMGRNGRTLVEQYRLGTVLPQVMEAYLSCAEDMTEVF